MRGMRAPQLITNSEIGGSDRNTLTASPLLRCLLKAQNQHSLVQEERNLLEHQEQELSQAVEAAGGTNVDLEDVEEEEEVYVDRKWRKIVLQPFRDAWSARRHAACAQMQRLKAFPDLYCLL